MTQISQNSIVFANIAICNFWVLQVTINRDENNNQPLAISDILTMWLPISLFVSHILDETRLEGSLCLTPTTVITANILLGVRNQWNGMLEWNNKIRIPKQHSQ